MATNNDHYNNGVVYRTPEGQLYDTSDLTYLMSPLLDVVVEATASPETKNKMQLGYNKKWQDWHKLYLDWWRNYKAAESKAELSDMNNYVRKGMNDFAQDYVFPAMTTALTAGFTSGASLLPKAAKAADVLWNPATTVTSRFANPLVRGAGKAADMIGVHLPVYRETAADIASKVRGDKNWFTDQQGNFDPMTTAETAFAPFIGAGAVKEGKLMGRAINGASNQLYKSILRVAPENPSKGFEVLSFPGYQLKGLMKGSLLEKQLSKTGTININLLNAYFNKASLVEREVANKVLNEKFAGQKTIDYNLFKKAVLDELIGSYNRVPLTAWEDYGVKGLGYPKKLIGKDATVGDIESQYPGRFLTTFNPTFKMVDTKTGKTVTNNAELQLLVLDLNDESGIKFNTFTFESPRIPLGSDKHYGVGTLGHSRTYTTSDEPKVLHVMESLSDWSLEDIVKKYAKKSTPERIARLENSLSRILDDLKRNYRMVETGYNEYGLKLEPYAIKLIREELIPASEARMKIMKNNLDRLLYNSEFLLQQHLSNNYLQRQLQENLRYAAENGLTKMRHPTSETAAKIEGYPSKPRWFTPEGQELNILTSGLFNPVTGEFEAPAGTIVKQTYSPEHQTILKKYADFPKLFLKLYKGQDVRTVTDAKGNTWYEVDVPKGYLNSEWQFKSGGAMKHNPVSIKYSNKIK